METSVSGRAARRHGRLLGPVLIFIVGLTWIAVPAGAQSGGPDTCSRAKFVQRDTWTRGEYSSVQDVDWFRFTLTREGLTRVVLGADGARVWGEIALYDGCSDLVALPEPAEAPVAPEIVQQLEPGDYRIRVAATPESGVRYLLNVTSFEGSLNDGAPPNDEPTEMVLALDNNGTSGGSGSVALTVAVTLAVTAAVVALVWHVRRPDVLDAPDDSGWMKP